MPARTTRQEARQRIIKSFMDSLDRIIPAEESIPLRGQTFLDWEHQADATGHPRRVLANSVAYFTTHEVHMNYPEYRHRGWPIGSGETEAAVKQSNKRIKGTEQFWSTDGVEAILALRGLWLSQHDRWSVYWENRPAYVN